VRVALNALAVAPDRPGGDATYVRELVRRLPRLAQRDEWVVFLTPDAARLFDPPAENVRSVLCRLPSRSLVVRALWEQVALPRLIERHRVDVVHAPVNVAPLAARVPIVLTLHEAEPFMPSSGVPVPLVAWWRAVRSLSARRAERIVTVSASARADLTRWMGIEPARIDVIPLGVDTSYFTPDGPAPDSAVEPPGRPFVLWVGRPYPSKNLGRLVAAFAQLRRSGRQELLVLAGPRGWSDAELSRAVERSGWAGAMVRRPPLGPSLVAWYRAAAAFAFPSLRETFGLPVLEALACGTPVVASDIPALRAVGGSAAVFADPLSSSSLARALADVLRDTDFRDRARATGPRQAAHFSWAATAEATYATYRGLDGTRSH